VFRSWRRLRHVPGSFWHSTTIYPLAKLASGGKIGFVLNDIQRKYGEWFVERGWKLSATADYTLVPFHWLGFDLVRT